MKKPTTRPILPSKLYINNENSLCVAAEDAAFVFNEVTGTAVFQKPLY